MFVHRRELMLARYAVVATAGGFGHVEADTVGLIVPETTGYLVGAGPVG